MATDEDLITAVAAGEVGAFEILYRRYERPLYHFLHRHTRARDVDDLYQETWMRVVRAAARFDPSRRFSTWLFQIALNLCRDWYRREPRSPADSTVGDASPRRGETTDKVEAGLDARRLLSALSDPQRSVVILRYYHGFSEADVAEILDCPRGTVKSRLHQAMARLRALTEATEDCEQ